MPIEAAETQSWLDFALKCGYLSDSDYQDLDQKYEIICGGLVNMMTNPEKWCGPANLLKEDDFEYCYFSLSPIPPLPLPVAHRTQRRAQKVS